MSAVRQSRILAALVGRIIVGSLAWVLLAPWVALIPRRRDWVAVIGRGDGGFADNTKYFLLQAGPLLAPHVRLALVTERRDFAATLGRAGVDVLVYPTFRSAWFLMRCGTLVVDEAAWHRHLRRFLLVGARKLQLWHGVGLKRTEIDEWRHAAGSRGIFFSANLLFLRKCLYLATGRLVKYDAVNTTSTFYRNEVFKRAFWAREFLVAGYPRDDFAQSLGDESKRLAWVNVDADIARKLKDWQRQGRRITLVAPTFRESGTAPMQLDSEALAAIDIFAEKHGVEFVFKFHPFERGADHVNGRHVHVCSTDSDIYPLLPCVAALVTDYSSISTDFLLVNKPILFFIPEGDQYTKLDRQLQFDPRTMMPGPVAGNWPALINALAEQWAHDTYEAERAALRRKAFDNLPQSEAVPKLIAIMRERGWLPHGAASSGL